MAPTVRLNRLASWGADRFARASFLNSLTSVGFHARRFSFFFFLTTSSPTKVMARHITRFGVALVKSSQTSRLWQTKFSEPLFDTGWPSCFLKFS
jgi:hypothetical protein